MNGIKKFILNVDVKPVTGVNSPVGAEIIDTSSYTEEDWRELLNTLFAPITYALR